MSAGTKIKGIAWAAAFALAVAAPSTSHAQSANLQGLNGLDTLTGVDVSGGIVVGVARTPTASQAGRWVNGTVTALGDISPVACGPTSAHGSAAQGVSADGNVVVGTSTSVSLSCFHSVGFRWTAATGIVNLGSLPLPCAVAGGTEDEARATNTDGTVVVGSSRHFVGGMFLCRAEAFRWLNGTMTGLGFLPGGDRSFAYGVSRDGTVVVGQSGSGGPGDQALRWTEAGGMTGLGWLPGDTRSAAFGVSADGSVIVGQSASVNCGSGPRNPCANGAQAFRWANGVMTGLGILAGGIGSVANAVSSDGSVVVGTSSAGGRTFAVRWTEADGLRSVEALFAAAGVNLSGWQLTAGNAVSGDGTVIVGDGINPAGQAQSWVARFGPPGSCGLASQFGDFNGDRRDDLLFRRYSDGSLTQYLMDGFQILSTQALGAVGTDWTLAAVADFNGDGTADLLFRRGDGMLSLYLMSGANVLAAQLLGAIGLDWEIVGAADFNGDGRADILLRRASDGMLSLYLMNGFQVVAAQLIGAVGPDRRVRAVRDFNGDGRADIVFRRASDGMLSLYLFNGFQLLAAQSLGVVGNEWTLLGARDFNGDGTADILFRRASDGMLSLYLMNGFQILQAQLLGAVGLDWTLLGLGDLNGDGKSDMVFRRASDGLVSIYLMNGFQVLGAQVLGTIGTELSACYGQPPLATARVDAR
jgi:probable HAF family extracellular repeat protein